MNMTHDAVRLSTEYQGIVRFDCIRFFFFSLTGRVGLLVMSSNKLK